MLPVRLVLQSRLRRHWLRALPEALVLAVPARETDRSRKKDLQCSSPTTITASTRAELPTEAAYIARLLTLAVGRLDRTWV